MRKVAFILNPISGRGRKKEILGYIEVMLKKYPGWEGNFYTTKGVGDASSAARKFAEEGYDVTAIELVKHNLGLLKAKNSTVKAKQGNALNLKKYPENYFNNC